MDNLISQVQDAFEGPIVFKSRTPQPLILCLQVVGL